MYTRWVAARIHPYAAFTPDDKNPNIIKPLNNHGQPMKHSERHKTHRTGWLRAAVLGANDGIVSTASLVLGVAATGASM